MSIQKYIWFLVNLKTVVGRNPPHLEFELINYFWSFKSCIYGLKWKLTSFETLYVWFEWQKSDISSSFKWGGFRPTTVSRWTKNHSLIRVNSPFTNGILFLSLLSKIPFGNGELLNPHLQMGQIPHYRNGDCRALWPMSDWNTLQGYLIITKTAIAHFIKISCEK